MRSAAYYNEIDRYCCDWLQNLMDAGHITPGKINDRPIENLSPDDVRGYERVHFFAGIGGWDYALNLARWSGPVWTGSCPCQPFSAAGKAKAADDERHLWPAWFSLIRECRPPIVFGEQVEAAIGWGWLDLVFSDLEAEGYACGATVLPACSIGAPHIRQRLWFVGQSISDDMGRQRRSAFGTQKKSTGTGEIAGLGGFSSGSASASGELADTRCEQRGEIWPASRTEQSISDFHDKRCGADGVLANANPARRGAGWPREAGNRRDAAWVEPAGLCPDGGMGNPREPGLSARQCAELSGARQPHEGRATEQPGRSSWSDCQWLPCTDGKARPVEPSTFPLAHGVPGRVGRLRAYGNAIVPQVAAEFIKATQGC